MFGSAEELNPHSAAIEDYDTNGGEFVRRVEKYLDWRGYSSGVETDAGAIIKLTLAGENRDKSSRTPLYVNVFLPPAIL